jgi:hypothetical protein
MWNGCGTCDYGNALRDPNDGSYVVTQWFVLLFLPLLPIRSRRIHSVATKHRLILYNAETIRFREVPLHWPHVWKGYAVTLAIVAVFLTVRYMPADGLLGMFGKAH